MKKNIVKVLFFCFFLSDTAVSQNMILSLDQVIKLAKKSSAFEIIKSDSLVFEYNQRLFDIETLPKVVLSATLPNLINSISPVTLSDGSERFVNRFYSTANVGLNMSQLVPFTGGTLSLSSALSRLDNYRPDQDKSYNLNMLNFSYNQKISGYNQYKWKKKLHRIELKRNNVQRLQQVEMVEAEAVELFFELYEEQRKLELNQFVFSFSQFIFERAKKLYDEKRISEIDYIESRIEYQKARINNNTININHAKRRLANFLNINAEQEIKLVFDASVLDMYKFDFEAQQVIDRAIKFSTDISREYERVQNDKKLKEIIQETSPSVSLSLGGGLNSQAESLSNIMDDRSNRINITLSFSMPILDWGANRLKRFIVKEDIRKLDLDFENTLRENLINYQYDLSYIDILRSSITEEHNLIYLLFKQIDVLKTNAEYGKIDLAKIIQLERELIQTEIKYIKHIRSLYKLIYRYRAVSLIDIRDNSVLI